MIKQMTEVPFSYMHGMSAVLKLSSRYEGSFEILDIISQAPHHNPPLYPGYECGT
jgi:hypothetical protein